MPPKHLNRANSACNGKRQHCSPQGSTTAFSLTRLTRLGQTGLLAKVGNPGSVVVGEHLVTEDGVGNVRGVHQVHFQEESLEVALLGLFS
jgi:hypothetical protein